MPPVDNLLIGCKTIKFWKSSRVKSFTGKWRIPVISHRKRAMRWLITESIGVLIPSTTSSFRDLLKKKTEEINSKTSAIHFRETIKFSRISKNFTLIVQQVWEGLQCAFMVFNFFLQVSNVGHGKVDYYISTLCKDACDHTSFDCWTHFYFRRSIPYISTLFYS